MFLIKTGLICELKNYLCYGNMADLCIKAIHLKFSQNSIVLEITENGVYSISFSKRILKISYLFQLFIDFYASNFICKN